MHVYDNSGPYLTDDDNDLIFRVVSGGEIKKETVMLDTRECFKITKLILAKDYVVAESVYCDRIRDILYHYFSGDFELSKV